MLATVMFTDIVGSTQRTAEVDDGRLRELRGNWHTVMRKELTAFRGREVDTAGDGLLVRRTPAQGRQRTLIVN